MLKKKSSHQVEVQESVDNTAKQFFPPNLTPGVSLNITCNPIGATKLLQSI